MRKWFLALGLPGLIWVTVFVGLGLYSLLAISMGGQNQFLFSAEPQWNPTRWDLTYLQQAGKGLVPGGPEWTVVTRTFIYILAAVTGCVVIGYPVAYFLAFRAQRTKKIILALLIVPFLVSYMLRMLAWVGLLSPDGWTNSVLVNFHIADSPVNWLGGMSITVILGLIYGWIPYFIIPLYASLTRFDRSLLEASGDLGSKPAQTLLHVTLPLSRQGIYAGMVIISLPMFGDFFTNRLLSGATNTSMLGTLIDSYSTSQTQQNLGAAVAVWLMVFLIIFLVPYLITSARAIREVAK